MFILNRIRRKQARLETLEDYGYIKEGTNKLDKDKVLRDAKEMTDWLMDNMIDRYALNPEVLLQFYHLIPAGRSDYSIREQIAIIYFLVQMFDVGDDYRGLLYCFLDLEMEDIAKIYVEGFESKVSERLTVFLSEKGLIHIQK